VLASSGFKDRLPRLWDAATGERIGILEGPTKIVSRLAWSPDGGLLAGQGRHGDEIWVWDPRARKLMWKISGNLRSGPASLTWSADSKAVACQDTARILIYDAMSGKELRKLEGFTNLRSVAWSPDGKWLACGEGGKLHVLDAATGEKVFSPDAEHGGWCVGLLWSPDSKTLISGANGGDVLRWWDVPNRKLRLQLGPPPLTLTFASLSPDGHMLATKNKRRCDLWRLDTGRLLRSMGRGGVLGYWSPDGKLFAAAGNDRSRIWEMATGKFVFWLEGHTKQARDVVWLPDGKRMASCAVDGTVRFWEAGTGKPLSKIDLPALGSAGRMVLSPDGTRVGVSAGDALEVWDLAARSKLHSWKVRAKDDLYFLWSPDGRTLATNNGKELLQVLDAVSGKILWSRAGPHGFVMGHPNYSLAWSADGWKLACGDDFGRVRVRDAATGNLVQEMPGRHGGGWIVGLGWSANGKTLMSAGVEGVVRFWDADKGRSAGVLLPMQKDQYLILSPEGHFQGSLKIEEQIVYVVLTEEGEHLLLKPAEFARKYGWKNDPARVVLPAD
jgi:WD40 repeat protein